MQGVPTPFSDWTAPRLFQVYWSSGYPIWSFSVYWLHPANRELSGSNCYDGCSYPAFSFCWLRQFVHHPFSNLSPNKSSPTDGVIQAHAPNRLICVRPFCTLTFVSSSFGEAANHLRRKCERAVPQLLCVASMNVSFPALRVCKKSKFTDGPSREFDGIKRVLTDATNRL